MADDTGTDTLTVSTPTVSGESSKFARAMLLGAIFTSTIILAAYVGVITLLFFFAIPPDSQQMAVSMFNTLQTLAILAAGFWLGSSAGSMQKGAAAAQATSTQKQ